MKKLLLAPVDLFLASLIWIGAAVLAVLLVVFFLLVAIVTFPLRIVAWIDTARARNP